MVVAAFALSGCSLLSNKQAQPTETPEPQIATTQPSGIVTDESDPATQYTFTAMTSGETVFELLQNQDIELDYQDYGEAGAFITGINGLAGTNDNYWAFYVNGEYSKTGVSQTTLSEGDVVDLIYEPVDATSFDE